MATISLFRNGNLRHFQNSTHIRRFCNGNLGSTAERHDTCCRSEGGDKKSTENRSSSRGLQNRATRSRSNIVAIFADVSVIE